MIPRGELLQVKRIASRVNPRIKEWAGLNDRKGREASSLTLAEGARLVREGLETALNPEAGRFQPVTLLISDSGAMHEEAGGLFQLADRRRVERVSVADACFGKISGLKNTDGLALVLRYEREEAPLSETLEKGGRWLVADGVQDPGNAGALARTALAAGCDGCFFIGGVDPNSPKFLRGAMGAAYRLPCRSVAAGDFVQAVRASGVRMLIADSDAGGVGFREADYGGNVALVIGGERGISGELAAPDGVRVHIPLCGQVESLNLAVAAGVILFEAERQWRRLDNE